MDIYESYDVLELKPGATEAEIKAQYRKLLHEWHPDRNRATKQKEAEATKKTALINNAYDVIKSHIIPYTIPKPENYTYQGPNGANRTGTGAAYNVRREPSRSGSWKMSNDISYTRRSYVKRIRVDGEISSELKVALGVALFLFMAIIFYGLTGARGLTLADLLSNRGSDSTNQNTGNSGVPNANAGTGNGNGSVYVNNDPGNADPYANNAPSLDNQSGTQDYSNQTYSSDSNGGQTGGYGSGSSGQSVNQGNPDAQGNSGTQGYSGAGEANEQNAASQNNSQGVTGNAEGSNGGMNNYYGNYNNYVQSGNGEGRHGDDDDDD